MVAVYVSITWQYIILSSYSIKYNNAKWCSVYINSFILLPCLNIYSSSCGDHIALYSGLSTQSSPIRKICSSYGSNFQFEKSLDLLYIRFQSDSLKGSGTGFRAHFKLKGQ